MSSKIINGKKYDTETAKLVAYADNGKSVGDCWYSCEELYKKKTGEYFLHVPCSGFVSDFFRDIQEDRHYNGLKSLEIIPLSIEKAQEWMQEMMSASEYEAEFGTVEE